MDTELPYDVLVTSKPLSVNPYLMFVKLMM